MLKRNPYLIFHLQNLEHLDLGDENAGAFKEYSVGNGKKVEVTIKANPVVNGYTWALANNLCGVRFNLVKTEWIPNMMPGAPGKNVFTFETPG